MNAGDFDMIRTNIALLYKIRDDDVLRVKSLRRYEGAVLKRFSKKKGDKVYYNLQDNSTGKVRYLGSDSDHTVKAIKELRYRKERIKRIDHNIDVLKKMLAGYLPIDYEAINNALPLTYRGGRLSEPRKRAKRIAEWKAEKLRIKASHPIKSPEQLKHTYVDGTKMRSKAELSDASCFDKYGVPYAYEVPIEIDGYVIYPDFRLLNPVDLETEYILEQFGRMDLEDYQQSVGWKISKYMKKGFAPGINFFMCFDDLEGNADLRPLEEVILKISGGTGKVQIIN